MDEERRTLEELLGIMREHDLDRIKVKVGDATYEMVRRQTAPAAALNGAAYAAPQNADAAAGAAVPAFAATKRPVRPADTESPRRGASTPSRASVVPKEWRRLYILIGFRAAPSRR